MATDTRPPSLSDRSGLYHSIEKLAQRYGDSAGISAAAILVLYLWAPIAVLTFMSFAPSVYVFPPSQLTLEWYAVFVQNQNAHGAIVQSLLVAIPVTIISVILATLIAYSVDRFEFHGKDYVQILATLPLIVPLVVGGIALIFFFTMINLDTGYFRVLIAHIIRTIPFTALVIVSVFLSFDRSLEEASMDLGADEVQTFYRVTLPNIRSGLVAGGLLAFTTSFNEFVYTFFVKDTYTTTLPVYIWQQVRHGISPEVNVISVVFIFTAMVTILMAVSLTQLKTIIGGK